MKCARATMFLCGLLLLLAPNVHAEELHMCIRARSLEPGRELLQTRQLKVQFEGAQPSSDLALLLAGRASREKLWPELLVGEVVAAMFDQSLCGNQPTAQLTMRASEEDLAAVAMERARGPGQQPRLDAVSSRAAARPAPPKAPPNGTSSQAR